MNRCWIPTENARSVGETIGNLTDVLTTRTLEDPINNINDSCSRLRNSLASRGQIKTIQFFLGYMTTEWNQLHIGE